MSCVRTYVMSCLIPTLTIPGGQTALVVSCAGSAQVKTIAQQ